MTPADKLATVRVWSVVTRVTEVPQQNMPDESARSCSWSGMPQMGGSTDGDEIVDRDCGLVDLFGRQRSSDPWIDGQLLSAHGDDR